MGKPTKKKPAKKGYKGGDQGVAGEQQELGVAEPISAEKVRELAHRLDEYSEKREACRRQLKDYNKAYNKAEELLHAAARQVKNSDSK